MLLKLCATTLLTFSVVQGCFNNESLNAEADILSCTLPAGVLKTDPRIENTQISFFVWQEVDVTELAPEFALSSGATLTPASGTARDFTTPQKYTVTSEDGNWQKEYTVVCSTSGITQNFDFEHSEVKNGYYVFYEETENSEQQYIWATGNAGYSLMAIGKNKDDYPTVHYEEGKSGKAVKLETKSTGLAGTLVRIYLIPGNLYIGSFNSLKVMTDPLQATQFGHPCDFIPTEVTGYYKYTSGPSFIDEKKKVVEGKRDIFHIFAVVYEADEETKFLNGHNFWDHENVVALAEIDEADRKETDEWTYFSFPFRLQPGKQIDPVKLEEEKYNLSLVFSSSAEGDKYRGAIGSTLLIDEVRLIREE